MEVDLPFNGGPKRLASSSSPAPGETRSTPGPDDLKEGRAAGAAAGFVNVFTSCCGTCNSVRYETDEVA